MHQGKYVFSQILDNANYYQFNLCANRYNGERKVRQLTCRDQFLALIFGHLSFRKSLRDIVVCLNAHREKLYHLGFRSLVRRSTLADANEHRDWRIYRDYAALLIAETRKLSRKSIDLDLNEAVYIIDSTTIELCLAIFPWARVESDRSAIKLHLGLELRGHIPAFFAFSEGNEADVKFLDQVKFETGAYYVFDRGYLDFGRFYNLHLVGAFFVTRAKKRWSFRRLYSRPVDKQAGIRCDQIVVQDPRHHARKYPDKLRRIKYYDHSAKRSYVFMTNNFDLPARVIADLYKERWQIELFFKWIKQHLAIETLWGRSANAVKLQICVALSAYLLVAILRNRLGIDRNPYEILQILSVSLFDKMPILQLISSSRLQMQTVSAQRQAVLLGF